MGLLHFHFLFFLGCPDGLQERFSMILVALWEPFWPSRAVLGHHLGFLGGLLRPSWGSWRPPKSSLGLSFDALEVCGLSCEHFGEVQMILHSFRQTV